jgi:Uma2 family endonuclease
LAPAAQYGHSVRMSAASAPRHTLAEALALLEKGEPVELIDGEIVYQTMTLPEHGTAQVKVAELLGPFNRKPGGPRGPGGWWIMTEVDVLYAKTEETYRHDAMGFRRDRHPERPKGHPVKSVPDWACEILSPSTARYDQVKKLRTLHKHGVPHYWIIDPEHETLTVFRHQPDGYMAAMTGGVGDVIRAEPFEAIELDVAELFGKEE